MNINICTINTLDHPGRQTVYWNAYDGCLYTSEDPYDPSDLVCGTLGDAIETARETWDEDGWCFEWASYSVKPEFLDQWGAIEGETFNVLQLADIARGWDVDPVDIMDQLEEVEA